MGVPLQTVTYGKGVFWRHVPPARYKVLATDIQDGVDCRDLPYKDGEIDCVVLDPPYMHTPGGTAHKTQSPFEEHYRNNGSGNQTGSKYHEAVLDLYGSAGREAYRVLRDRGVLIVKCQDEVCSNRQRFTHVEIIQLYTDMGYVAEDLFVVMRNNRPGISCAIRPSTCSQESLLLSGILETWRVQRALGVSRMNAVDLLANIIQEHSPKDIWRNSPFAGYRLLGNTNRSEIGEEFIRRYLGSVGIKVLRNQQIGALRRSVNRRSAEAQSVPILAPRRLASGNAGRPVSLPPSGFAFADRPCPLYRGRRPPPFHGRNLLPDAAPRRP